MEGEGDTEMAAEIERLINCNDVSAGRLLSCLPRKPFLTLLETTDLLKVYTNYIHAYNMQI